jgi:hypothetical protein
MEPEPEQAQQEEGGRVRRPREVTQSTLDAYQKNIIRLNGNNPIKINKKGEPDYKFLKDYERVLARIQKLKPNSQRSYLISIVATLKGVRNYDMVSKFYWDLMMKLAEDLKTNNTKSETQKENWLSQAEVMEIYKELGERAVPLISQKKVTEKEWNTILDFVVLSLYVLNPPRRNKDYAEMLYMNAPKELPENYKDFNYYNAKDNIFEFFSYKTKNTYGLQETAVNEELKHILAQYLKLHPLRKNKNFYLLTHYDGSPLSSVNAITRILNKIFNRKIGASMLRNIYLSDKFKPQITELNDVATAMGTSPHVAQSTYIKMDD